MFLGQILVPKCPKLAAPLSAISATSVRVLKMRPLAQGWATFMFGRGLLEDGNTKLRCINFQVITLWGRDEHGCQKEKHNLVAVANRANLQKCYVFVGSMENPLFPKSQSPRFKQPQRKGQKVDSLRADWGLGDEELSTKASPVAFPERSVLLLDQLHLPRPSRLFQSSFLGPPVERFE